MTNRGFWAALALGLALATGGCAPEARRAPEPLRLAVAETLVRNGFAEVDVDTLTVDQMVAIDQIAHGHHSPAETRGLIASTLGGRYALRGLLTGG